MKKRCEIAAEAAEIVAQTMRFEDNVQKNSFLVDLQQMLLSENQDEILLYIEDDALLEEFDYTVPLIAKLQEKYPKKIFPVFLFVLINVLQGKVEMISPKTKQVTPVFDY